MQHRMPVVIPNDQHALWLDPASQDETRLSPLLQPFASEQMEAYEVSRLVNAPKHNCPACVQPVTLS